MFLCLEGPRSLHIHGGIVPSSSLVLFWHCLLCPESNRTSICLRGEAISLSRWSVLLRLRRPETLCCVGPRQTIRMRHLELRRLNTKRPAVWQVELKHFGTVPSLSECQMGLNFTNRFHTVTWVRGNNGECGTSPHRWDQAHWGQFRQLFISVEVDLLP